MLLFTAYNSRLFGLSPTCAARRTSTIKPNVNNAFTGTVTKQFGT